MMKYHEKTGRVINTIPKNAIALFLLGILRIAALLLCHPVTPVLAATEGLAPTQGNLTTTARPRDPAGNHCTALLDKAPENTRRIEQIRQIFKENLHWQTDRHLIMPRKTARWSDINTAYTAMHTSDLPILIHLIGTGQLSKPEHRIALGVLTRFGPEALPCIEAGINPHTRYNPSDLSAVKINIQVQANEDKP